MRLSSWGLKGSRFSRKNRKHLRQIAGFLVSLITLLAATLLAQELKLGVSIRMLAAGYDAATRFSSPQGIFYDRRTKELYVCDTGNHQVVIFDSTGLPVYRFKHWVIRGGKKILGEPRSVVANSNGDIFLADNLCDYLDILNFRGGSEERLDLARALNVPSAKPLLLALDERDYLYVVYRNEKSALAVFDPDLQLVQQLENRKENHQDFGEISGLWVDSNIYVTDATAEPCVRVFLRDGTYLLGFGTHEVGWDGFSLPSGVTVTQGGIIWIADTFRQVVKAFSPKGVFLRYIGGFGVQAGAMDYPAALAGDGSQLFFVLEKAGERFQGFEVAPEE
ncbi:MAG TPA: NHL repeat-containing protein [candidate division Zixibacteria bacterium]|nr:NHL repeat-containing protein [candidate division Zixibacteria bacterium]